MRRDSRNTVRHFVEPVIERALTDGNLRVRRMATGVLGAFVLDKQALNKQAITALRRLAEEANDKVVRTRAQATLYKVTTPETCVTGEQNA